MTDVANKVADDLRTILSEAEKHGTLPRLKQVGIYFDEAELRAIVAALTAKPKLFDALKNMAEWWAYAIAKPPGAEPNAEDHKKVEQLAADAITALHAADPTYIHRLPNAAH